METLSALMALYEGNPPVIGGTPSRRAVARSFDVFLDLRLIKTVEQTIETPLICQRLHRAHSDITVMVARKNELMRAGNTFIKISCWVWQNHHNDVIMSAMASQITSLTIVYSTVYPAADQSKHQSSTSLASARGIHRWPVNSRTKGQ